MIPIINVRLAGLILTLFVLKNPWAAPQR